MAGSLPAGKDGPFAEPWQTTAVCVGMWQTYVKQNRDMQRRKA